MTVTETPESQEIERVLLGGDLAKLNPDQRLAYYNSVCKSLGLNPLTRPFDYIVLKGKMQLYAKKDCTDQLRNSRSVSVDALVHDFKTELGIYVVTAHGSLPTGRRDTGTGAVGVNGLKGDDLANAIMKAETKAKRRMTLSICGLGILDESEIETIRGARAPELLESGAKHYTVAGEVTDFRVFQDKGCSVIKIGKDKFTITDLAVDKILAGGNVKGKEVEIEIGEAYGPNGKYAVVTRVLRIGNYDFTNADDLTPQLQAGLDAVTEVRAIDGAYDLGECASPEGLFKRE